MLCETHRLIAHKVYEIIINEFDLHLDHESLMNGSVAPDRKPSMLIVPHTKSQSQGLLNKNFNWLMCTSLTESNKHNKEVSYKLGIVIHLISDYFCRSHNEVKYLNPVTHYIYEKRLKNVYKKRINRIQPDIGNKLLKITGDLNSFINIQHAEYLQRKKNMGNDILSSLETVVTVIIYIISNLIKEPLKVFSKHPNTKAVMTA